MSIAGEISKLVKIFKNWGPSGELQPATADTLGGVKVGEGLSVTEDGTLSANNGDHDPIVITVTTDGTDTDIESTMEAPVFYALIKDNPENFGRIIIHAVSTESEHTYDFLQHPTYMNVDSEAEVPYVGMTYGEGGEVRCSATEFFIPED